MAEKVPNSPEYFKVLTPEDFNPDTQSLKSRLWDRHQRIAFPNGSNPVSHNLTEPLSDAIRGLGDTMFHIGDFLKGKGQISLDTLLKVHDARFALRDLADDVEAIPDDINRWIAGKQEWPLPEGYIAATPGAGCFAVSSDVLAKNGELHIHELSPLSGNTPYPLDPFVETTLAGDLRLEGLRTKAKQIGHQYGDTESPDYISDQRKRESIIANTLGRMIHETYGDYSVRTVNNGYNEGEMKAEGFLSVDSARLADMEKNSLVCRHQAPIMGVLLEEAGIPNYVVVSWVTAVRTASAIEKVAANALANEHHPSYEPDVGRRADKIISAALQKEIARALPEEKQRLKDISASTGNIHLRLAAMPDRIATEISVVLQAGGINDPIINRLASNDYLYPPAQIAPQGYSSDDGHAYVVTKSGALIEATESGRGNVYYSIINGVTAEQIVYGGQVAFTKDGDMYGGHRGDGYQSTSYNVGFFDRLKAAEKNRNLYNMGLPASLYPYVEYDDKTGDLSPKVPIKSVIPNSHQRHGDEAKDPAPTSEANPKTSALDSAIKNSGTVLYSGGVSLVEPVDPSPPATYMVARREREQSTGHGSV